MHDIIDTMANHGDTILPVLVGVFLTNWLTNRSRDLQDRAADRAALQAQVDAFITAAATACAAAETSEIVWEGPKEKRRATAIVLLGAIGGWASAEVRGRSDNWRYAVGLRDAAQLISREVHARKVALASLQATTVQLGAAASAIDDRARLERALAAFGEASRAALQPTPSIWSRLLRRTR